MSPIYLLKTPSNGKDGYTELEGDCQVLNKIATAFLEDNAVEGQPVILLALCMPLQSHIASNQCFNIVILGQNVRKTQIYLLGWKTVDIFRG